MTAGITIISSAGTASIGMTIAFDRRIAVTSLAMIARITRPAHRRDRRLGRGRAAVGRPPGRDARLDGEVHVLERRRLGRRAVHVRRRAPRAGGRGAARPRGRPPARARRRASGATIDTPRLARTASAVAGSIGPPRSSCASTPSHRAAAISSGRPKACRTPRSSTAMRLARRPASPRKCVHSTTVRPCSVASEPMRSMTSRVADGSSPDVGSSRNSTSGSWSSARASASRLR